MIDRNLLNKPHYVFRPSQLARRIARSSRRDRDAREFEEARLPWGATIAVRPEDEIGSLILRLGVFDLCVSEAIWRLLDPGATAVDAGANIGHMTSVMATRVGARGAVFAFEPHPVTFGELSSNVARWRADPRTGDIRLHELALSDRGGTARLGAPADFDSNRGSVGLLGESDAGARAGSVHEVALARLDEVVDAQVGVLKIDVEGHELEVLRGAGRLLSAGRVRDVLFEEWDTPPTPVTTFLENEGYALFSMDQALLGPSIGPAGARSGRRGHQAPSYLATRDPARALSRLRRRGWAVLGTPLL